MKQKTDFLINVAYWSVILLIIFLVIRYVTPVILPFLLGFAVAALCNRPISRLSRRCSRAFSSAVVVLPIWCVFCFVCWRIGILVFREAADLLEWIAVTDFSVHSSGVPIFEWISQRAEAILPSLLSLLRAALSSLLRALMALPNALLFSLVTVVSSFLFALHFPRIEPFLLRQMSPRIRCEFARIKAFFLNRIVRILRAQAIMVLLNFAILFFGFCILRIRFPILPAALLAVLDLLPYVGVLSVLLPWGLIEWIVLGSAERGIGLIVLATIAVIVHEIAEPRILGRSTGLPALAALFSIYLGIKLMGFMGIFVFPLAFMFLKEWNATGRLHLWNRDRAD